MRWEGRVRAARACGEEIERDVRHGTNTSIHEKEKQCFVSSSLPYSHHPSAGLRCAALAGMMCTKPIRPS